MYRRGGGYNYKIKNKKLDEYIGLLRSVCPPPKKNAILKREASVIIKNSEHTLKSMHTYAHLLLLLLYKKIGRKYFINNKTLKAIHIYIYWAVTTKNKNTVLVKIY